MVGTHEHGNKVLSSKEAEECFYQLSNSYILMDSASVR
jgi:hypothetical protein